MKRLFYCGSLVFICLKIAVAQNNLFAPATNYGAGYDPTGVVVNDFDRDGDEDIAVSIRNGVAILRNNGNGSFQNAVDYTAGIYNSAISSADYDNDGDLDLAVIDLIWDSLHVLFNNDSGAFRSVTGYPVGMYPNSICSPDLDNDNDMDIVIANNGTNNISSLINNGTGTFQAPVDWPVGLSAIIVTVAKIDTDSYKDIIVADGAGASILINDGNGSFPIVYGYQTTHFSSSVIACDFNNDGDCDLAITNWGWNNYFVSILENNGQGIFEVTGDHAVNTGPYSVWAGDFNGDMANDLAVANYYSGDISLLLNNGNGTFGSAVNYNVGGYPNSLAGSDFDNDGDIDLAISTSNGVSLLLNRSEYLDVNNQQSVIASDFRLAQNYPNPFNAQTTIGYSVPEQTHVVIDIFDLLGRKVETLNQGMQAAGQYRVTWDASSFSSGMYFYRLSANDNYRVGTMLLIK